ncbi:MAG: hypothetical protein ACK5LK_10415 [Chthoniobacterales bacterium]
MKASTRRNSLYKPPEKFMKKLRISYLSILLFMLIRCQILAVPPIEKSEKPNIILILADDLGYETITANGGESYQTAHLDRLAECRF